MTDLTDLPETPDPKTVYHHRVSLIAAFRGTWQNRGLIVILAERNLRMRYKQALLGFAWAFISPIALLVAMNLIFTKVGNVDTSGAPALLFTYVGLLPWTFFAGVLNTSSSSILGNLALIQKIACPREVFPLSSVVMGIADSMLSLVSLGLLFVIEGFMPRGTIVWLPLILIVHLTFVIGVAIFISVATVYFRDIRNALPLVVQLGLFITPVAYGFEVIPKAFRGLYSLYPLGPVIDSYRRTVLLGQAPQWQYLGIAAASSFAILVVGFWLFKKMEVRIADVA